MNVFILTDLEGIGGVTDIGYMERGSEKYEKARLYLTQSINLASDICFQNGAAKVYYLDGHGGGGNVIDDMTDDRLIKCDIAKWQQLLRNKQIDCQIELGAHARAGTVNGFLDHTINSRQYFCIKINGMEMSELSMHALLCAKYGVPVVACTGDETACAQAKEYVPGIYTGSIKKAECRNSAVMYENADGILADTIKKALADYKKVPLFKLSEPMRVELTFYRTDMCDEAYERCKGTAVRTDARTLQKTVDVLEKYEDMKF